MSATGYFSPWNHFCLLPAWLSRFFSLISILRLAACILQNRYSALLCDGHGVIPFLFDSTRIFKFASELKMSNTWKEIRSPLYPLYSFSLTIFFAWISWGVLLFNYLGPKTITDIKVHYADEFHSTYENLSNYGLIHVIIRMKFIEHLLCSKIKYYNTCKIYLFIINT